MQDIKSKIGFGVIGLGKMGQNHLRVLSILKGAEIEFIYDLDLAVSKDLAKKFGVKNVKNFNEALPHVNAIVICSPTNTHSKMLRIASKYSKNILIEKPLSHNIKSTRADVAFIKHNNLNVQVGLIERFNPAVQQLKYVLEHSEQVLNIDFTRTDKVSSRIVDVDVVNDLMIHDIDLAIHLSGPVTKVAANGVIKDGMIVLASANLVHENGCFSRLHSSRITEKKIRNIQATCIDAFVDCDLLRKELQIHRQSKVEDNVAGSYSINAVEQTVKVNLQEPLLTELQSFIAFCHSKTDQVPNQNDALSAAEVCQKIIQKISKPDPQLLKK